MDRPFEPGRDRAPSQPGEPRTQHGVLASGIMAPSARQLLQCHLADVLGASRLVADGTAALADIAEDAHRDVRYRSSRDAARLGGIPGLVYGSVRTAARLAGQALALASPDGQGAAHAIGSRRRDAAIAALNGVVGDHLAATGNPLASPMRLIHEGRELGAAPLPRNPRVLVLVNGLCMGPRQWRRRGHDHGEALARELGLAPVYLQYNTGLHVSENGRRFADALEELRRRWPVPVEELAIVAHSMGGLVARSACHAAAARGHDWPRALRRLVFLGTPHHGAPLERGGQRLELLLAELPYVAPFARLGRLRSAGITDLRHGSLLDEDWANEDRFAARGDRRRPVPLPAGVECHALAAAVSERRGGARDAVLGDGLVPVASALGEHPDAALDLGLPPAHRWVGRGMHHFQLLDRPEVYAQLRARLTGTR